MLVEVCVDSLESALIAEKNGAHRLELCAALAVGGITPSYALIRKVIASVSIPVHVLIRPRAGNFTYTPSEIEFMIEDIKQAIELGASGIVSGCLHLNRDLDQDSLMKILEASQSKPFTFHRAIDWVSSAPAALDFLQRNGVSRVLSSGLRPTAEEGIAHLKAWKTEFPNLIVIPASGIQANNAEIFKTHGFQEIHLSASETIAFHEVEVPMNSPRLLVEDGYLRCSSQKLTACLRQLT